MKKTKQISTEGENTGVTATFFDSSVGIGLLVFAIGSIVLGIATDLGSGGIVVGAISLLLAAFGLFSDIRNLIMIIWLKNKGKAITAEISSVHDFLRAFAKAEGRRGTRKFYRLTCFAAKERTGEKTTYNSEGRFRKKYLAYEGYTVLVYIHPENEMVYFVDIKTAKEKA